MMFGGKNIGKNAIIGAVAAVCSTSAKAAPKVVDAAWLPVAGLSVVAVSLSSRSDKIVGATLRGGGDIAWWVKGGVFHAKLSGDLCAHKVVLHTSGGKKFPIILDVRGWGDGRPKHFSLSGMGRKAKELKNA